MQNKEQLSGPLSKQEELMEGLFMKYHVAAVNGSIDPLEWVKETSRAVKEYIRSGALFTPSHHERFVNLFSPLLNRDHPIWQIKDGHHVAVGSKIVHFHREAIATADYLVTESQITQEQLAVELKENPIQVAIDRETNPHQAARQIEQLIDEGFPFTSSHHRQFLQEFSPFENMFHPSWNWDQSDFVHVEFDTLKPVHQSMCQLADGLLQRHHQRVGPSMDDATAGITQEVSDDPILLCIRNSTGPSEAAFGIKISLLNGHPFTAEHHEAFTAQFSPFHNKQHPYWSLDDAGRVCGYWEEVQRSHQTTYMFADALVEESSRPLSPRPGEDLSALAQQFQQKVASSPGGGQRQGNRI